MAFFCTETGRRIAAPGVCKLIDPIGGQDEVLDPPPALDPELAEVAVSAKRPARNAPKSSDE